MLKKELLSLNRKTEICAALKQIMKRKNIQKITIQEIADECGISRYTFYYHFTDIYDCLSWSIQEDIRIHSTLIGEKPTWNDIIAMLIHIIQKNKSAYKHLLSSPQPELLHNAFRQEVRPLMQLCVSGLMDDNQYKATEAYETFLTDFFTAALEGLSFILIQEDLSDPDNLLIAYLHTILDGVFEGILGRAEQQAFCTKVEHIPQGHGKHRLDEWNYLL